MKTMKLKLAAAAATLLMTVAAHAANITYSTVGIFGDSGTSSISDGGLSIDFTGLANNMVSTDVNNPTALSFGVFKTSGSGSGDFSTDFFLTITQHSPANSTGSQTFGTATIAGNLTATSSGLTLMFPTTPNTAALFAPLFIFAGNTVKFLNNDSTVTYFAVNVGYTIAPPSSGSGETTIQGGVRTDIEVPSQSVPLPASVWGGLGTMAVLGGLQLRRKLAK